MRVVIRTDIGGLHGMGHASRMLALARELAARSVAVGFLTQTEALASFVSPVPCQVFGDGIQGWPCRQDIVILDTTARIHEPLLRKYHEDLHIQIVHIDHQYAAPEACDLLIVPNMHTAPHALTALRTAFGSRLLVGAEYVMLPQEVTEPVPIPYAERMDGPIVFCAGGSDPEHILSTMFAWLGDALPTITKYFCLARYGDFPFLGNNLARHVHVVTFDRALLREAALVVTTFGQVCYEAMYWHTPTLVVGHTDRHCAAAQGLGDGRSLIGYVGDVRSMTHRQFTAQLNDWWQYPAWRQRLADASAGVLDGRGVERVAAAVMELK